MMLTAHWLRYHSRSSQVHALHFRNHDPFCTERVWGPSRSSKAERKLAEADVCQTHEGCVTSDGEAGAVSLVLLLKVFHVKTCGAFFPIFFALREINSCKPSSVVSTPRLPSYSTTFFTVACKVPYQGQVTNQLVEASAYFQFQVWWEALGGWNNEEETPGE